MQDGQAMAGNMAAANEGPVPLEVSPKPAPMNPANGLPQGVPPDQLNRDLPGSGNQLEMVSPQAPPSDPSAQLSPQYHMQQPHAVAGGQMISQTSQNVTFQVSPSPARKAD